MNYAAAFAAALGEALDAMGAKKSGFHKIDRPDPDKVETVKFEGEEAGGYSSWTNWDAHANLIFEGPKYCCYVDLLSLGRLNLGEVVERAVEILNAA